MFIESTKGASADRIKGVILGPSGVGKTYLASTAGPNTLLISAESGHLTLNKFDIPMIDLTVDKQDDKVMSLDEAGRYQKLLKVFDWLKTEQASKKFKTIYVDGITELGGIVIRMLEKSEKFGSQKMAKPRYGEYTKKMTNLILGFRDLPYYNIWFTALVEHKEDVDEKSQKVIRRHPASVLMPGQKIPENLPAFFDEILYYGIKGDKRYILTQATDEAFAKDRSGNLEKFEKPNLAEIAMKIKGEVK